MKLIVVILSHMRRTFSTTPKVKSERAFICEMIRVGVALTCLATILAVTVTWWTTHNYTPYMHHKALRTALILPLIVAPTCMYIIGRIGLRNHRQMLAINALAFTDELTGLANRRAFMRDAAERLATTDLNKTGVCIMIVDLDHFKRVNDQYGHDAGDTTLINVARQMERALPASALIARLGGEEFAVMASFNSMDHLNEIGENLRARIASRPCAYGQHNIQATASIGAGIAYDGDSTQSIMSRADSALYGAKHEGRNRFMLAA